MRRAKTAEILCFVIVFAVITSATVLIILALCRKPPAASQEPPVVSPGLAVPEPSPVIEPAPTPPPEITPQPEPTEPPYDIWSDPNVLWGEGKRIYTYYAGFDSPYGYDSYIWMINESFRTLVETAGEESLVVFELRPFLGPMLNAGQLDLSKVIVPEEWEFGPQLMETMETCVEKACEWEELERELSHIIKNSKRHEEVQAMGQQLRNMMHLITNVLPREEYPPNTEGNDAYYAEVRCRLMADEDFVRLYQKYSSYCRSYIEFYRSLYVQELAPMRDLLLEKGFIPVYGEEDVTVEDVWKENEDSENTYTWLYFSHYGNYEVRSFIKSRLWAFAGTREQIGWIEAILKGAATDFPMLSDGE